MSRAEITAVIRQDDFLEKYDRFHEQVTGMFAYSMNDEWWAFRNQMLLASHTGIAEEREVDPTKMVLD